MPFTVSHAAAILPFRRRLPPSALATGAMVPDLPYYLPLPFSSRLTHGWWGTLLVDLPAGLAVLALFHLVLRAPLTSLAPEGLRARLPGPERSARGRALAVPALLAGTATHLVWDAFTQVNGFAVRHWAVLRMPVVEPHKMFNVVMYVSSLGGLVVLAAWFALWYRRAPLRPGRWPGAGARLRGSVLLAGAVAAVVGAALLGTGDRAAVSLYDLVRGLLLGGICGAAAVAGCYAAWWHARRLPGLVRTPGDDPVRTAPPAANPPRRG
ncbi:hypothetical protein Misp01_15710 [Microtetraspora sp. NBRC 13810]|uniref:DUF4184 family protein n=1 Tax=Microtetraspora sp. NBRC 13810 TaxID=3030990 RepID=UPI0024A48E1D|nr:DUF4184 family protein [Microtetraspora sp. NBRC 13810]GLW06441.1 hypothetical protein Misp01_15710 [Microtetraspora sp. NBRC 13810]